MKSYILLALAGLAVTSSCTQAGELFRWTDDNGRVYYGDAPPAGVKAETRKFANDIMPSEYLPYETRRAQQNFPVTLYVADDCGELCNQARSLLNKRGIPFNEQLLKTRQEAEALKQLSGIDGIVPVLAIGKNFLKGFQAEQWHSELDIAGYPKSAPYRAPVTPAASSPSLNYPFAP